MVINVMDRDFNFLGQIDNYESLILGKKYHAIGGLEMYLHEKNVYADKLQKETILFTAANKAYIILYRQIDSDTGTVIVRGLELKSYLKRIVTFPPTGLAYHRINSNAETIMKNIVAANLTRKNISAITIAPNQNRGATTIFQTRYKNLAEELEKISLATGLGWDITLDLDNKTFVFDVMEGKDLTAGQTEHPPAIFSLEYDNIAKQTLIESRLDYANVAIVAGQGEGADREVIILGETEGLDNYEMFVDARDLEEATDLPARGEQKLAETQEILIFDSEVLTDKNLIYGKDFNLGDIATLKNSRWHITADRRITGLTEIYESDGFKLGADFGEGLPTVMDKIKRAIDVPVTEGGTGDGYEHPNTHPADMIAIEDEDENFVATDVEGALEELFTNVSDGKDLIAGAITDKDENVVIPSNPTFGDLADGIGEISSGGVGELVAGNNPIYIDTLEMAFARNNNTITHRKVKVTELSEGSIRISFDFKNTSIGNTSARIYINDSAAGVQRYTTTSNIYQTFTEEFNISKNDVIELRVTGAASGINRAHTKNFIISIFEDWLFFEKMEV